MKKTAIITGILGQDGPYLAKLLLEKNIKYTALSGDTPIPISAIWTSWELQTG